SHTNFPWLAVPPPAPAPAPTAAYYQDDEPVEDKKPLANNGRGLVLKTHCEFPAIGRGASRDKFAVLVHARAPADVARAPLDLVTVLDVSGSMDGEKLALLKRAMAFVIDQLGPADRLSVVSFSDRAARLTCLARMSDAGKASAKLAVESLVACAGTNIREGLHVGAQVLVGRRHKNSVASMILLSDGQDSYLGGKNYMDLVPPSFKDAGSRPGPIHTFGFGTDHDALGMHTIAQATGGTFSFVGNQAAIQDSFAQCIGGLLSVAVQEARITLYDGEERRFLVLVYVPRARPTESVTRLVKVTCAYKDAATGQAANAAAPAAVIQRPLELTDLPPPCMEVERERVRLAATQDIAAARDAAEGGQHAGAARMLDSRLKAVERSAPGMAGDDPTCEAIKEELRDLSARVGDRREYQQTGRAALLAGMSSHSQQRASAVELQSASKPRAYLTPKM
uniref:VWFA domain-containing protein n=1 Tax=Aegilops tauschii subsp. strangulata TaxID=200361 RepID=A0A453L7U6_AEGTS